MKPPRKYITTNEARRLAAERGISLTRPTLIRWCQEYNIGHQLGGWHGRWVIYPQKFKEILDGEYKKRENQTITTSEETKEAS